MTPDALELMESSPEEIGELLGRYATALEDARVRAQSVDGRYVDAYTAGFLLAKLVVRAAGYRVRGGENHLDTLRAVPWIMGTTAQPSVDAIEAARRRRNATMYDAAGLVDEEDVVALIARVEGFESQVRTWLADVHPELLPTRPTGMDGYARSSLDVP